MSEFAQCSTYCILSLIFVLVEIKLNHDQVVTRTKDKLGKAVIYEGAIHIGKMQGDYRFPIQNIGYSHKNIAFKGFFTNLS